MRLEAKFERKSFSTNTNRETNNLLIKLISPPATTQKRQPLVIGLAIDKSWSMKGEKMEATIEAASSLVNWLTREDYIGIVAYSANIEIIQPLTKLNDKTAIIEKISSIQVGTSTNLSGGWLQILREIDACDIPNAYKRALLLTDGQATLGLKDPIQFTQIAADHSKKGIATTTIGFGDDFNESSLREIAMAGGGNFYYVATPEQTSEIFFKEFGDIGALYGQALELKLKLPENLKMIDLLNDIPHRLGNANEIIIQPGDMRSDDVRNVIVSFEFDTSNNALKNGDVLIDIELTFYNLLQKMQFEKVNNTILLSLTDKISETDNEVLIESLVAMSAKSMMKASKYITDKNLSAAHEVLHSMVHKIEENLSLSPEIFNSILTRLKTYDSKLKENVSNVSKQLVAGGSLLFNRSEMIEPIVGEVHNRIYEFKTTGDIDLYNCPDIKLAVQNQMKEGYRYVIFDLASTRHVDSSGIGAFIQIVGWLRRRGGELIVTNMSDGVNKVFSLTRLENHIRVAASLEEARRIIEDIINLSSKISE